MSLIYFNRKKQQHWKQRNFGENKSTCCLRQLGARIGPTRGSGQIPQHWFHFGRLRAGWYQSHETGSNKAETHEDARDEPNATPHRTPLSTFNAWYFDNSAPWVPRISSKDSRCTLPLPASPWTGELKMIVRLSLNLPRLAKAKEWRDGKFGSSICIIWVQREQAGAYWPNFVFFYSQRVKTEAKQNLMLR